MTTKRTEDEWFARQEEELLRQARRERQLNAKRQLTAEAEKRRELHWMKCPKCGEDLLSEAVGTVTLDRCAGCDGVFLDRGELEGLLLEGDVPRRGFFRKLLGLRG